MPDTVRLETTRTRIETPTSLVENRNTLLDITPLETDLLRDIQDAYTEVGPVVPAVSTDTIAVTDNRLQGSLNSVGNLNQITVPASPRETLPTATLQSYITELPMPSDPIVRAGWQPPVDMGVTVDTPTTQNNNTTETKPQFRGSTAKAKENYSYSGSDVSVFFVLNKTGKVVFANDIQTISISTHPAKGVIRTLGRRAPVTYVEGSKTVAGTLVFSMLREDPFVELLAEYNNLVLGDPKESRPLDSLGRQSLAISADQLPPIDIMLLFHNEYDQVVSIAKVMNVHIIDNGMVSSSNDMYTEITYQYVAEEFMPPISRDYYDWIVNQRNSLPSNLPATTPTTRPDTKVQTSSTSSGEKIRSVTGTISQIKIDSDGKIVVKLANNSNEYTIYGIRTNVNMLAYQTTMTGIIGSGGLINVFIDCSKYTQQVTVTEVPGTENLEYMIQQNGVLLQTVWVRDGYVYPTQEAYENVLRSSCNDAITAKLGIWAPSVNMPTPSWIEAR